MIRMSNNTRPTNVGLKNIDSEIIPSAVNQSGSKP